MGEFWMLCMLRDGKVVQTKRLDHSQSEVATELWVLETNLRFLNSHALSCRMDEICEPFYDWPSKSSSEPEFLHLLFPIKVISLSDMFKETPFGDADWELRLVREFPPNKAA